VDSSQNKPAKKEKGNLTNDPRTLNREENPITKVKLPEQREPNKKADLDEQKRRLEGQGRGDNV
jgi:hypothetical protein